jgi:hypothetical protein
LLLHDKIIRWHLLINLVWGRREKKRKEKVAFPIDSGGIDINSIQWFLLAKKILTQIYGMNVHHKLHVLKNKCALRAPFCIIFKLTTTSKVI